MVARLVVTEKSPMIRDRDRRNRWTENRGWLIASRCLFGLTLCPTDSNSGTKYANCRQAERKKCAAARVETQASARRTKAIEKLSFLIHLKFYDPLISLEFPSLLKQQEWQLCRDKNYDGPEVKESFSICKNEHEAFLFTAWGRDTWTLDRK